MASSLQDMCLEHLISDIDLHVDRLRLLPIFAKNFIFRRLNHSVKLQKFFRQSSNLGSILHNGIERLDICYLDVTEKFVDQFPIMEQLTHLTLGKIKITDEYVDKMFKKVSNIYYLRIDHPDSMNDAIFEIILKNCCRLQQLELPNCQYITDKSIHAMINHCRIITALNLSHCSITSQGLKLFLDKFFEKIVDLRVMGLIMDDTIQEIIEERRCPNLIMFIIDTTYRENMDMWDTRRKMKHIQWVVGF